MFSTICFDLDGTLVSSENEIGTKTVSEIKKLKEKGIKIVLVSGRHFDQIIKFIDILSLSENDLIISYDGQYIFDGTGTEKSRSSYLCYKDLIYIYELIKPEYMNVFTDTTDYRCDNIPTPGVPLKKRIEKLYSSVFKDADEEKLSKKKRIKKHINFQDFSKLKKEQAEKITISDTEKTDILSKNYSVFKADNRQISILHKEVNKYNALCIAHKKGLIDDLNSILYFGDDYNDEKCFSNLKHTVAMSTSPDEILNSAEFIAGSCSEDGVGEWLCNHREYFE